jgi:DNA-binding transcriptional LysR family regulator
MAHPWDAETFVAIVEAGGLSAAAGRLGRTQPTVSRQLAALETRLGVRLLERTTRRLRLTTAGRAYYERCRDLLVRLRDADELVADMGGAVRGTLRVSMPPTYARRRIVPLLPAFFRAYPELRLEVVLSGERADLVGTHFDLVVRLGPLGDSTLRCRVLSTERFVLCASPRHLAEHGMPTRVGDLPSRRCLVTETFGMRGRWLLRRGQRRSAVDVSPCLVSDDLALLHDAARAGLGLAALPEYLVAHDLGSGALVRVLPRHRLPAFRAYALLPSGRHVARRVRVLLDFLTARLHAV